MTAKATTVWVATPDDWKQRLGDAVQITRELNAELELDELERDAVLHAALEAVRHHGIITEQVGTLPIADLRRLGERR